MKFILLLVLMISAVACGNKEGGGSSSATGQERSEIRTDCSVIADDKSPLELAKAADQARKDCQLSEDEAVIHLR